MRHCLGVQMHLNLILVNSISCKPKTEKYFSNEDSDIFTKLSSCLKPRHSKRKGAEGKCCGRNNSMHPIWCPCWVWFGYWCFTHIP